MKLFQRRPVFIAKKVVDLPFRDSGVMSSIVRVHPSRIDAKRVDKNRLFRRQAVTLKNTSNGVHTVRFVMGAGDVQITNRNAIAVDYDTRDALGLLRQDKDIEVKIYNSRFFEVLGYFYNHPDFGYQVATRLGFAGVVLGVIGATLGIISLVA